MKKILFAGAVGILAGATGIGLSAMREAEVYDKSLAVNVHNPLAAARTDEMLVLSSEQLRAAAADFNFHAFVVRDGSQEIASQAADLDGDGEADQLLFAADLASAESKNFTIHYASNGEIARQYSYAKRAYAELAERVGGKLENGRYTAGNFRQVSFHQAPPEHKPQDMLYKYEGPGWESDKVAYRLYFDSRNATDIFGKKTSEIVLPRVGVEEDNYHEMLDWGMDILKVGDSLGIGALGMRTADGVKRVEQVSDYSARIVEQGPLRARVRMQYKDWQPADESYQLQGDFSIDAGSRLTRHQVQISGNPQNLVTGIVKHPAADVLRSPAQKAGWGYLASYGKQSFIDDGLGMAVLYRHRSLIELSEDAHSQLVVMRPQNGELEYYFLAAWILEPGGVQSKDEFIAYLDTTLARLNNPLQATINGK